ncbi:MAG: hypothetical protein COB15_00860 [Flavobacteriales bacterium]|nr:MAG: hypothetical protein COB15_00860 [Flavobacteriales bacterium]
MKTIIFLAILLSKLVEAQTGPGGVGTSSSNIIWVKADANVYSDAGTTPATSGDNVRQWNDVSGNGLNGFSTVVANQPEYELNAQNGYPGIRVKGNQFISFPAMGIANNSSITYIMAFKDTAVGGRGTNNNGSGDYLIDRVSPTNELFSLKLVNPSRYGYQKRTDAGSAIGGVSTTTAINNSAKVIEYRRDYGVDYQIFYNNSLEGSAAEANGPSTPPAPQIGRHCSYWNQGLRGYIYEFIIYNFALNTAQTIIVNNYLSAKYGFSLSANDCYSRDDVGGGDYDHDVAGIGRVDAANIHNDAQGTGIVRILNPTGLGDDEFLMWGHDNGAMLPTTTDIPAGVEARLERVWRVSERNANNTLSIDVENIDMRWDLTGLGSITATDLCLLIDTDNDGVFSDETPISGATSLGNDIYEFANVPGNATGITNDRKFTLGTLDMIITALPITLISFEANLDVDHVELEWVTATEINNDFFTIEKSIDAISWEEVVVASGAGNSNQVISYFETDYNPMNGISYYRLKQTDFNGAYEYHGIRPVTCEQSNFISIYPSPFKNSFTIKLSENTTYPAALEVVDYLGRTIYAKTLTSNLNIITLDKMPHGTYFIKVTTVNTQVVERIVKTK